MIPLHHEHVKWWMCRDAGFLSEPLSREVCVCIIIRFDSMVLLQLVSAGFLLPPRTSLSPKHMCALNSENKWLCSCWGAGITSCRGILCPITRTNIETIQILYKVRQCMVLLCVLDGSWRLTSRLVAQQHSCWLDFVL